MKLFVQDDIRFQNINVFEDNAENVLFEYNKFIESLIKRGEDNIDCFRIADKSDKEAVEIYKELNGSCLSEDIEKEINGIVYMFGANFLH